MPLPPEEAVRRADLAALCLPDETMPEIWRTSVSPHLAPGAAVLFAHGFGVVFGGIAPPGECLLVSPCGPGTALRSEFLGERSLPAFVASRRPSGLALARSYASAIGCRRQIATTFEEETVCDLFGEQAVLCGGMPWLARTAWETLVEAGYSPQVAFEECVAQVRRLADLLAEHGLAGMLERVSDTAEFGAHLAGPQIVSESVRDALRQRLDHVRSGGFAAEWTADAAAGKPRLRRWRAEAAAHPLESHARP